MPKRILFTVISFVLAYYTYKLTILFFELAPEEFSLVAIIVIAAVLNILLLGTIAFLGFVYPTHVLLSKRYYKIKNPETLNVWYKWLGVEMFRLFLLNTFYRKKDNKKYFNGSKAGILAFDYNTKQSEFGHLIALIVVSALSLVVLVQGHTLAFLWMLLFNILLNLYPVILQRKHRIIIERLIDRMGV